jgi:hypothetical protein
LDNLWKTIDDVEAQEQKAQELINKMNTDKENEAVTN